jgi:hypothetical protein
LLVKGVTFAPQRFWVVGVEVEGFIAGSDRLGWLL